LGAAIRRRTIVISERAGREARSIIVEVADGVGERPVVPVVPCFSKAGCNSGRQKECSGAKLYFGHLDFSGRLTKKPYNFRQSGFPFSPKRFKKLRKKPSAFANFWPFGDA